MKSLLIMRHGAASGNTGAASDFERPLNNRGKQDVLQIAKLLRQCALMPDLVVSSLALRAKQTTEGIAEGLERLPAIAFDMRLYGATVTTLLTVIRALPEQSRQVLIIGHNPGLEELICWLCDCQKNAVQLPPAGLVSLQCAILHWSEIDAGQAVFQWFVTPQLAHGIV